MTMEDTLYCRECRCKQRMDKLGGRVKMRWHPSPGLVYVQLVCGHSVVTKKARFNKK